ncbi:MAG: helix-turn-helix domain-containing protein [Anaerolineales bacterium]|nr:helix-turn-helix domain-containing protein [Anaerolineales bacterium]
MDYTLAANIRAKKLGVLIRDARLKAGETMKDCGDIIGASGRTISKYEDGEKSPSLPELEVLAYYLNIPLDQFWGKQTSSSQNPLDALGDVEQRLELRDRTIGLNLRKAREAKELSMREVADKLDITTYRLKSYEKGKFSTPLPVLEQFAEIYGLDLDELRVDKGPIAEWSAEIEAINGFVRLPAELQQFVTKPVNRPYLSIARQLSEMSVDKLRAVAEGLLEITL